MSGSLTTLKRHRDISGGSCCFHRTCEMLTAPAKVMLACELLTTISHWFVTLKKKKKEKKKAIMISFSDMLLLLFCTRKSVQRVQSSTGQRWDVLSFTLSCLLLYVHSCLFLFFKKCLLYRLPEKSVEWMNRKLTFKTKAVGKGSSYCWTWLSFNVNTRCKQDNKSTVSI